MNIQTEKLGLIEWLSKLNDATIIERLWKIKDEHTVSENWWETIKEEELESINRGLKDFEDGNIHSHETARKVYGKSWKYSQL
jgi:hypothetical protein